MNPLALLVITYHLLLSPTPAYAASIYDGVPSVLVQIAQCESGLRQFDDAGEVIANTKTHDYGIFQVHSSHLKEAKSMGLDVVNSAQDNITYALYLYKTQGTSPWLASKYCWGGTSPPLQG